MSGKNRIDINKLPPKYRAQAEAQLASRGAVVKESLTTHKESLTVRKSNPALRQERGDGLNKTERDFKEWRERRCDGDLIPHGLTFKLANGVRYTPDFVWHMDALECWEVKGTRRGRPHIEDDASVKIKVAARTFPRVRFFLAWKNSDGIWQIERVLP